MANEIHLNYTSGKSMYCQVRNRAGLILNVSAEEAEVYSAGNWTDYDIALSDKGGDYYVGDFPSWAPAGTYQVVFFEQLGASPAATDIRRRETLEIEWSGSAAVSAASSSSYYDESFLTRGLADFREQTDEPEVNAKYPDARVVRKLEDAYATVLGDVQRVSVNPVVAKYTVVIADGTEQYALPPTVGTVMAVYQVSDAGARVFYSAYGRLNPIGRGVWVEGKTLHVQPGALGDGAELVVEYLPLAPRLCNGTCTVDSGGTTVSITGVYQGTKDTRNNAYAGCTLRIIGDSDDNYNYVQERTITAHNSLTDALTLDVALSPNPNGSTGTTYFEIAPAIPILMDQVIPVYAAWQVALREGTVTRANMLRRSYWDALRSVQLGAFYSDLQNGIQARHDNFNNRRYRYRR